MNVVRTAARLRALPPPLLHLVSLHFSSHLRPRLPPRVILPAHRTRTSLAHLLRNWAFGSELGFLQQAANNVLEAASSSQSMYEFRDLYKHFQLVYLDAKKSGRDVQPDFIGWILHAMLRSLALVSTRRASIEMMMVYKDIKAGTWGVRLAPHHFPPLVRVFASREEFPQAETFLRECVQLFPGDPMVQDSYHYLIREYRRRGMHDEVWKAYRDAKKHVHAVDKYVLLSNVVDSVLEQEPNVISRRSLELEEDLQKAELGEVAHLSLLLRVFIKMGLVEDERAAANKLAAALKTAESKGEKRDERVEHAWAALLHHSIRTTGIESMPDWWRARLMVAFTDPERIMVALIKEAKFSTMEELEMLEQGLQIKASYFAWAALVDMALNVRGVEAAMEIYDESRARSMLPTTSVTVKLIDALCKETESGVSWANITRSLRLYSDLVDAYERYDLTKALAKPDNQPLFLPATVIENKDPVWTWEKSVPDRIRTFPTTHLFRALFDGLARYAVRMPSFTADQFGQDPLKKEDWEGELATQNSELIVPVNETKVAHPTLWKIAVSLHDDMYRMKLDAQREANGSLLLLLMHLSPTYEYSFIVYRALMYGQNLNRLIEWGGVLSDAAAWRRVAGGNKRWTLTPEGWQRLLRGVSSLPPKVERGEFVFLPVDMFIEMIKDMQTEHVAVDEEIYATLFDSFARHRDTFGLSVPPALSDWVPPALGGKREPRPWRHTPPPTEPLNRSPSDIIDLRESLLNSIRVAHRHIRVSASLTPSTRLLNVVLSAYQSINSVVDAAQLWDLMAREKLYDNQTLSILLQLCGRSKLGSLAAKTWNELALDGFAFDKKNWDTRVECLCMMGRVQEALRVVCVEMPQQDAQRRRKLYELRTRQSNKAVEKESVSEMGIARSEQAVAYPDTVGSSLYPDVVTLRILMTHAQKSNSSELIADCIDKLQRYVRVSWELYSRYEAASEL